MPSYEYSEEEVPEFKPLKNGDYIFEVVGCDQGISNSGKTNGCACFDLKLLLFESLSAGTRKVAQITTRLTLPETRDNDTNQFLRGLLNMFVKAADMFTQNGWMKKEGAKVEFGQKTLLGLRGWCRTKQEPDRNNKEKIYTRIDRWLTDMPKLARIKKAIQEEDEAPF